MDILQGTPLSEAICNVPIFQSVQRGACKLVQPPVFLLHVWLRKKKKSLMVYLARFAAIARHEAGGALHLAKGFSTPPAKRIAARLSCQELSETSIRGEGDVWERDACTVPGTVHKEAYNAFQRVESIKECAVVHKLKA